MGVSGQLYQQLPLLSVTEPAAIDVDLRDGLDMENTSATTFTGRVVGDSIDSSELIDVELYERRLITGSPIFF